MKLKQIVCDKSDLTLTKEKKQIKYGEVFEVNDEARIKEILNATYKDKPVVAIVEDSIEVSEEDEVDPKDLKDNEVVEVIAKEVKTTKKNNK